jgi:hypothetical protein
MVDASEWATTPSLLSWGQVLQLSPSTANTSSSEIVYTSPLFATPSIAFELTNVSMDAGSSGCRASACSSSFRCSSSRSTPQSTATSPTLHWDGHAPYRTYTTYSRFIPPTLRRLPLLLLIGPQLWWRMMTQTMMTTTPHRTSFRRSSPIGRRSPPPHHHRHSISDPFPYATTRSASRISTVTSWSDVFSRTNTHQSLGPHRTNNPPHKPSWNA